MRSSFKPEEVDRIEMKAYEVGISVGEFQERKRILNLRKEIINCVINYGLTPEVYERVCDDIEKVIKGEN